MRIAGIIKNSVVNGVGIRDVIFTQGCPHRCQGCHNPETWKFDGGTEMTVDKLAKEFKDSANDITISGGEPFWNYQDLFNIILELKVDHPNKKFWIYTGYKFEELNRVMVDILCNLGVEVIVDGRYERDKRDLTLQFRGSSNQRIIDVRKSLEAHEVILWEERK
jgi:anaerobic ribonucleoside-triphosphate reductase activating protein